MVGAFLDFNDNPTVIFGDNYGLIIGKFSELFHYIKITMVYARFKMLCIVLVFSTIFCEMTGGYVWSLTFEYEIGIMLM